jgi:hypothetical protein
MSTLRNLCAAGLVFGLTATAAAAQYRDGMPGVNAAPPPANPDVGNHATSASFSAWYAKAGRPSMLLFWNRELTDDATTEYESRVTTSTGAAVASVSGGGVTYAEGALVSETTAGQRRLTETQYSNLGGAYSQALESAYLGALLNAGVKVIDREAMMRTVSRREDRENRLDKQWLETLALEQGIKYLIEVLPNASPRSPTGMSFTIKVTHLPTSTVKAQFVTSGDPPVGPTRIMAGPNGLERRAPEGRRTDELVGAQLAFDTMNRLR